MQFECNIHKSYIQVTLI